MHVDTPLKEDVVANASYKGNQVYQEKAEHAIKPN